LPQSVNSSTFEPPNSTSYSAKKFSQHHRVQHHRRKENANPNSPIGKPGISSQPNAQMKAKCYYPQNAQNIFPDESRDIEAYFQDLQKRNETLVNIDNHS